MPIETVTVFRTWIDLAETLKTDAERGRLYHAICRYALIGERPTLEGALASFFELMRPSIDKSVKRKKAAANRWQTDMQNGMQNDMQNNMQSGSTRGRLTGTGKKRVSKDTPKEKISFAGLEEFPSAFGDEFRTVWLRWEEHRREIRHALTKSTARSQLKKLKAWGKDAAIRSIESSIEQGYTGLFIVRSAEPEPPANSQPEDFGRL